MKQRKIIVLIIGILLICSSCVPESDHLIALNDISSLENEKINLETLLAVKTSELEEEKK